MFVTLPKKINSDHHGFYVIRMVDFYNFAFQSPVPLFFIPTHRDYGHIEAIIAKYEDRTREVSLYIKSEHDEHSLISVDYNDLTDLIKAQLITYALNHMLTNPSFKKLIPIIQKFEKKTKEFYQSLNADLSRLSQTQNDTLIPESLKNLVFASTSVQELSQELSKSDDHPALNALKE